MAGQPTRGGKREGAGRPSTGKKKWSRRLSPEVMAILEQQKDQTAYVEAAVLYYSANKPQA